MFIFGGVGIMFMMSVVCYFMVICWEGDIYFIFSVRIIYDFIFE